MDPQFEFDAAVFFIFSVNIFYGLKWFARSKNFQGHIICGFRIFSPWDPSWIHVVFLWFRPVLQRGGSCSM